MRALAWILLLACLAGCAVEEAPPSAPARTAERGPGSNLALLDVQGHRAATSAGIATFVVHVELAPGSPAVPVDTLAVRLEAAGTERSYAWEHAEDRRNATSTYSATWHYGNGGREAVAELRGGERLEMRLATPRALPTGTTVTITVAPALGPPVDTTFTIPPGKPGEDVDLA